MAIENRLRKIPFMSEPGRKMFAYDSLSRYPVDWLAIKRHNRSFLSGAKVTMALSLVGDESGDTLAVLKNKYLIFRTERPHDHLSEDVVVCMVPGVSSDTPINEPSHVAFKSRKASGNKHQGANIGNIWISQDDVLSQTYSRGVWNPIQQHHLVFTFQAAPTDASAGRKRMRYLKDTARAGDT